MNDIFWEQIQQIYEEERNSVMSAVPRVGNNVEKAEGIMGREEKKPIIDDILTNIEY